MISPTTDEIFVLDGDVRRDDPAKYDMGLYDDEY